MIVRRFSCDAPECEGSCESNPNSLVPSAPGILTVSASGADHDLHFCDWDCCLKYAATIEPTETIPFSLGGDAL